MSSKLPPYKTAAGASWIATRLIQNNMAHRIAEKNDKINIEQLLMLMELNYEDGLRPSVLAERMMRSKGTISSLIKHAQRNEFIASSSDPNHKNAKRLYLTVYGKKVHDELTPIIDEELEAAMDGVPAELREEIVKVMFNVIRRNHPSFFDY
ncbi:hypothetical protein ABT56_00215 [Photobacterium aquae]|uniref:HTH marR-type domain-containing protein n=1 Tax=Photobacterium aquae TaxID=1195763 RepID=A0A0J1HCY3_9GAMM|nr:MarR family transcriptional regulator [Photobacterium aquae]KLV09554.1 hypothetical protein ABT56_00215 [Photobacterium aquae]